MYLRKRFYLIALAIILVMIAGRAWLPLLWVGQGLLALLVAELIAETVVLWFGGRIEGSRTCADRFSNGDDNVVIDSKVILEEAKGNIIKLPKGCLGIINGLEGYIVALEGNVLMVCKKGDSSALIRKYVNEVQLKYGDEYI